MLGFLLKQIIFLHFDQVKVDNTSLHVTILAIKQIL